MSALYEWLWTLLPANPITVRIVQGGSRRLRDLWVRMGYLGVLTAIVTLTLLSGGGVSGAMSLSDLAKSGAALFTVISYGQVILVCLLAPLFMAGAIAQEQAGQTFDILLTTPLSSLQIVLGNLMGRLFFVLSLLASGLPLFAVVLIFGGVPVSAVFVAFALAALVAVVVGSVAVTLSVMRKGGRKAVYIFVIAIAGYLVLFWAGDRVIRFMRTNVNTPGAGTVASGSNAGQTTWITPLHPLLVLEASINSVNYQPPNEETLANYSAPLRFYLGHPLGAFATLSILISGGLVLWSAANVRRVGASVGRLPLWSRIKRTLKLEDSAGGDRTRASRSVWANPVAWREANARADRVPSLVGRILFVALALAAASWLLFAYHKQTLPTINSPNGTLTQREVFQEGLLILLLFELAVIVMVAIYMSAGSVSREREDGTLDLLLTTPITPQYYIWGKLRGLVSFLMLLLAAPVLTLAIVAVYTMVGQLMQWPQAMPHYTLFASPVGTPWGAGPGGGGGGANGNFALLQPEAAILLPLMLIPFVAFCVAIGLSFSVKQRTVLTAVIFTLAIIGVIALFLGFCGHAAAQSIPLLGPIMDAFSPVTNLEMLVNPFERTVSGYTENEAAGRVSVAIAAAVAALGYSGLVWAIIQGTVKQFDQTVRRLSGATG